MSDIRELVDKSIDGSLTDAERQQLIQMMRDRCRDIFDQCPACGGAFSISIRFDVPMKCPLCDTSLTSWSSDVTGHGYYEVDESLTPDELLGVFSIGYSFPGTTACLSCGCLYPQKYTCCPQLLQTALRYFESGDHAAREAAVRFVDRHSSTLLNVLHSRFIENFDHKDLDRLRLMSAHIAACPEVERWLNARRD